MSKRNPLVDAACDDESLDKRHQTLLKRNPVVEQRAKSLIKRNYAVEQDAKSLISVLERMNKTADLVYPKLGYLASVIWVIAILAALGVVWRLFGSFYAFLISWFLMVGPSLDYSALYRRVNRIRFSDFNRQLPTWLLPVVILSPVVALFVWASNH